jgi:hypothetical protein
MDRFYSYQIYCVWIKKLLPTDFARMGRFSRALMFDEGTLSVIMSCSSQFGRFLEFYLHENGTVNQHQISSFASLILNMLSKNTMFKCNVSNVSFKDQHCYPALDIIYF